MDFPAMTDAEKQNDQAIALDPADEPVINDAVFPQLPEPGNVRSLADAARIVQPGYSFVKKFQDALTLLPVELGQFVVNVRGELNLPGHPAAAFRLTSLGRHANLLTQEEIMAWRTSMLVILVVLAAVLVWSRQISVARQAAEGHVVPLKTFPLDHRYETVSGDPAKSGEPFVIRIHAEAGYIIMPHTHSVDENIVVVKGSWALGMGERYNPKALEPMEIGDYGFAAKKMAHFALSKTETIIQVHGIGPFMTRWVVPMYELTDKGVLLETSAAEPGRMTTSPPDCFALKLGARVRGSYGEGIVVAAQCTPGQLTQYRIEKENGERFWAQRDELSMP